MFFDTIVAPITGSAPAAVAVVRVSGPEAWAVASRVFQAWPEQPEPRRAIYGTFAHGDDGLVLPFEEGHSYTGEETVEMSIHGSPESVRELVSLCISAGARPAEPGEFTQRAFLNGRIDLTQAEAVCDTVQALTDRQLRLANLHREGALRREIEGVSAELTGLLASVEASVDFSEEVGELDRSLAVGVVAECLERLEKLGATADVGNLVRRGLRVAIVGPPNVGKSSLLNALLGRERAIVSAIPGTTRDFVEEMADFQGFPVVLIDTAGLRESVDPVEEIGVQRSLAQAAGADLVWYVYDAELGWSPSDDQALSGFSARVLVVGNKADLAAPERGLAVSAVHGSGLDALLRETTTLLELQTDAPAVNARQSALLAQAAETLQELQMSLTLEGPDDLVSVLLHDVLHSLGQITGETATADLLERIFRDFCIGK